MKHATRLLLSCLIAHFGAFGAHAAGIEKVLLDRFSVPTDRESCSVLQPAFRLSAAGSDLKRVLSLPIEGQFRGSLRESLSDSRLTPDLDRAMVMGTGRNALYLIPVGASPTKTRVALVSDGEDSATAYVLTMIDDPATNARSISLSNLLGDESYTLDLVKGEAYQLRDPSLKSVAGTLLCLWNAIANNVFTTGDLACIWSSVVVTCVSNFTQCLGAVQTALAEYGCTTGVNILANVLGCFYSSVDTTPPTITSFTPSNGATVSSPISISCSATDSSNIQSISLLFDSISVATCSTSPCNGVYSIAASYPTNRHSVSCVALDIAGISNSKVNNITLNTSGGGSVTTLQNGVSVTGLSGSQGNIRYYKITVPLFRSSFRVQMSGGSGDADLYVRYGALPTSSSWACRPYTGGNSETCTFPSPASGDWFIMVQGYSSFSGVSLVATY